MSAMLTLAPTQSQAQVSEVLFKCAKSLVLAFTCVIVDAGIKKTVEVNWDVAVDVARGIIKALRPGDYQPSTREVGEVEQNGIEWSKLREFLISVYKSGQPVDNAKLIAQAKESCVTKWHTVCTYVGIARPSEQTTDCSKIMIQNDCELSMFCRWRENVCTR